MLIAEQSCVDFRIFRLWFLKTYYMKKISRKEGDKSPEDQKFPLPVYPGTKTFIKKKKKWNLMKMV